MGYKTIDDTGADATWAVRENCVWLANITAEIDCVPVDLTGAAIRAVITAGPTSNVPLKTFTVTITSPTTGDFTIEIAEGNADLAPGTYWWALEWDLGSGDEPLASGPFVVEHWVMP
jgi:hypothetical protein